MYVTILLYLIIHVRYGCQPVTILLDCSELELGRNLGRRRGHKVYNYYISGSWSLWILDHFRHLEHTQCLIIAVFA